MGCDLTRCRPRVGISLSLSPLLQRSRENSQAIGCPVSRDTLADQRQGQPEHVQSAFKEMHSLQAARVKPTFASQLPLATGLLLQRRWDKRRTFRYVFDVRLPTQPLLCEHGLTTTFLSVHEALSLEADFQHCLQL